MLKKKTKKKKISCARNCTEASSSFSGESEREEAGEPRQRRDRMCVEFVALPQEISVAQTESSRGDCVRESLAVPKTLLSLSKQCQSWLPTRAHAHTQVRTKTASGKISNVKCD